MPRRTKRKNKGKFGYVAIAGRPNAGKSTLLNALLGAKLAIVSAKAQTTRGSIMGVLTEEAGQAVFLDTPGIHKSDTLLNRRMMQSVRAALEGKDLLLYVVDARTIPDSGEICAEEGQALDALRRAREAHACPALLVLNKIDLIEDKRLLLPRLEALAKLYSFDELIPVSARSGDGLRGLREAIFARLPEGEARFEEDFLTDMPERQIVAEIIRERILHLTGEEVPHSVAVMIDKWEDKGNLAHVAASILVEKEGQKGILIGAGGAMIKRIGSEARREIEEFLGRRFFLELFVKVKPGWRENEAFLNELGWQNTSEVI
ncbi:MAG: GTPase Era [Bryobacter sp.]|jgi:GTP-binding protein Era|nr:GTPase Era [Bryobacter sp. CoA8 C33]